MVAMWHAMRQFVTSRKDEVRAVYCVAIGPDRPDTSPHRSHISDLTGGQKTRAVFGSGFQQSECAFPWIDDESAIPHDRGDASDPELLAKYFPI
jgi:hypothetical protein